MNITYHFSKLTIALGIITLAQPLTAEVSKTQAPVTQKAEKANKPTEDIQKSRQVYTDIMSAKLSQQTKSLKFELGTGGQASRWKDSDGKVRRVKFSFGGEHSALIYDVYFDLHGKPRFGMINTDYWGFTGKREGETIDKIRERRFYITESGQTIKVLEKRYQSIDGDKGLKQAATAAKNKELKPANFANQRIVRLMSKMQAATDAQLEAMTEELSRADEQLLEKAPALEENAWVPVKGKYNREFNDDKNIDSIVFGYLMEKGLITEANTESEGNYQAYSDLLNSKRDDNNILTKSILVTASGLMDDSIQAERYLVKLTSKGSQQGKLRISFIGKQVKNWPNRGQQGWRK